MKRNLNIFWSKLASCNRSDVVGQAIDMLVIQDGSKVISLNARQAHHLLDVLREEIPVDLVCDSCHGLGYLEVTTENGEEIQTCQECNIFNQPDEEIKQLAIIDGIY